MFSSLLLIISPGIYLKQLHGGGATNAIPKKRVWTERPDGLDWNGWSLGRKSENLAPCPHFKHSPVMGQVVLASNTGFLADSITRPNCGTLLTCANFGHGSSSPICSDSIRTILS
jgi:hypothetical protein